MTFLYLATFFSCGIIYIVASYKIQIANRIWERILVIAALCQFGVIGLILILGILGLVIWTSESMALHIFVAFSLFCMVYFALKARPEF